MKTFTQWVLALVLVATPTMVTRDLAFANTELVPASRLVAPFVSATSTRPTFLLITNVSAKNLVGSTATTGVDGSVHLEFYNKTCTRTDRAIHLSPNDIDQINVAAADLAPETVGFVDLDVRANDTAPSTSIQQNALVGVVIITDSVSDFALSYPMAASLGSAQGGVGKNIVTRDLSSGLANVWTGRYEAFPTTIMVPGFFAEGTGSAVGAITESLLAIASPADGNWYGGTGGFGEAPGQNLVAPSGKTLIDLPLITVFDGCEFGISRQKSGHYLADTLVNLFGTQLDRSVWTASCGAAFGAVDEVAGTPVGWINLPNISCVRSANANFATVSACAGASAAPSSSAAKVRGVVGMLFEVAVVKGGGTDRGADVSRLWGDPSTITGQLGCKDSQGVAVTCPYSLTPISIP